MYNSRYVWLHLLTTKSYSCVKKDNYFVWKIVQTNCEKKSKRLEQIVWTLKHNIFYLVTGGFYNILIAQHDAIYDTIWYDFKLV